MKAYNFSPSLEGRWLSPLGICFTGRVARYTEEKITFLHYLIVRKITYTLNPLYHQRLSRKTQKLLAITIVGSIGLFAVRGHCFFNIEELQLFVRSVNQLQKRKIALRLNTHPLQEHKVHGNL